MLWRGMRSRGNWSFRVRKLAMTPQGHRESICSLLRLEILAAVPLGQARFWGLPAIPVCALPLPLLVALPQPVGFAPLSLFAPAAFAARTA